MSTTDEKLVRMINQIAAEFEHQQGAGAADATWDHVWHFWDPRMRQRIVARLDAGGIGLSATARAAVTRLKTPLEPRPRTPATDFGTGADGAAMSDAG